MICVLRQGLNVLPQAGFKFLGIGSVSTSALYSVTWSMAHLVWATSWMVLNPDSNLEMELCPQVLAASEMEETLCGKCALCLTHCDRQLTNATFLQRWNFALELNVLFWCCYLDET